MIRVFWLPRSAISAGRKQGRCDWNQIGISALGGWTVQAPRRLSPEAPEAPDAPDVQAPSVSGAFVFWQCGDV